MVNEILAFRNMDAEEYYLYAKGTPLETLIFGGLIGHFYGSGAVTSHIYFELSIDRDRRFSAEPADVIRMRDYFASLLETEGAVKAFFDNQSDHEYWLMLAEDQRREIEDAVKLLNKALKLPEAEGWWYIFDFRESRNDS